MAQGQGTTHGEPDEASADDADVVPHRGVQILGSLKPDFSIT
jgi:hypothetical protein